MMRDFGETGTPSDRDAASGEALAGRRRRIGKCRDSQSSSVRRGGHEAGTRGTDSRTTGTYRRTQPTESMPSLFISCTSGFARPKIVPSPLASDRRLRANESSAGGEGQGGGGGPRSGRDEM